jgi:hypothetical protein
MIRMSRLVGLGAVKPTRVAFVLLGLGLLGLGGCDEGARHAQREIIRTHVPRVQQLVREDVERGLSGVQQAAQTIARGFLVEDPERRAREIRSVLRRLREPPRGISELMISPIAFVAAVGLDGVVICRDLEPDPMAGFDAGAAFELVRRALDQGVPGYALVQFPSSREPPLAPPGEGESESAGDGASPIEAPLPSPTMLYVAPAMLEDRVVGAVIAGTPLWREAQRLGRQLQADHADEIARGLILWVYLYHGDRLHHHGTPTDLDTVVPDGAARRAGLARSAGGFTGELVQYGRWYAYGVVPLPRIGPDVGAIVFRSDP